MARTESAALPNALSDDQHARPAVVVVLVTKDAAGWIRQCLGSLKRQTHRRLDVVAVDNASRDGTPEILESVLGPDRVIRLPENEGFSKALSRALEAEVAATADYFLFLHDDAALAADAVEQMIRAAEQAGASIVGPKVLDWRQPALLREVGFSTDRFGYTYSPLEQGEVDHGQYDRPREVLFVSSCVMLVSRQAVNRIGLPDERFASHHEDLDFCWRARLSGLRVVMTPFAVALHQAASSRGQRDGASERNKMRYYGERGALASILKNYGWRSLAWVLPLYFLQGVARVLVLAVARRFEDAYQVLAAWGWNLAHLPGTLRRRVSTQAVRSVSDREVRRLMAPAGLRLRRWTQTAAQSLLVQDGTGGDGRPEGTLSGPLRFAAAHPVAVTASLAIAVALIAYRNLLGASPLAGAALSQFPSGPAGFFAELVSPLRHTGLGGHDPASPALGIMGLGSILSFGSTAVLQKVLLLGLPLVAGGACYKAVMSLTGHRAASALSASCYGLSATVLWGVSDGRIPELVFFAGLPWLSLKISQVFRPGLHVRPLRWVVGAGVGLAVLGSFFPGVALAAALIAISWVIVPVPGVSRVRGAMLTTGSTLVAAILAFPVTATIVRTVGEGLSVPVQALPFAALARLSLGPAPGSWLIALYLPAAAALAGVFVFARLARPAVSAALAALLSIYLAWLSSAAYLPPPLSNAVAYVGVAAFSLSLLVGLGLASLVPAVRQHSFGHRQLASVTVGLLLVLGLGGQAFQAMRGAWAVGGPERLHVAYPLIADTPGPPFRVLWLGGDDALLPPPAGMPDGVVTAGHDRVRFAVRDPAGASALDFGRQPTGPGYDYVRDALREIGSATTSHGGALLAPLGVRFVVADPELVPPEMLSSLRRQLDLDELPVQGLRIFSNAKWLPLASDIPAAEWRRLAPFRRLSAIAALPAPRARPLSGDGDRFSGEGEGELVLLSQQFVEGWKLEPASGGRQTGATRAFGWATSFAGPSSPFKIAFDSPPLWPAQMLVLAALWLAALWVTRRPVIVPQLEAR